MMLIALGCVGIFLCAASDLAQLAGKAFLHTGLFYLGCIVQVFAAVGLVWFTDTSSVLLPTKLLGGFLAAVGLGLLIYTLFFSLPKDTYRKNEGKAITCGIWSLCRHPGILFYFLSTVGLSVFCGHPLVWLACFLWSFLDLCYAYWQDKIIFPKTLQGYAEYQLSTPFLIPRLLKKPNK